MGQRNETREVPRLKFDSRFIGIEGVQPLPSERVCWAGRDYKGDYLMSIACTRMGGVAALPA
jgi:hypothetical protein